MIQAAILGLVQGITEFLPISSTAHLVLIPMVMHWQGGLLDSLSFDVALHAGTLVSLLICFNKDILKILKGDWRMLGMMVIGTIPAGVIGVLFHDQISGALRTPYIIAAMLALFGLVMYASDRFSKGARTTSDMTFKDALIIGAAQAVALVPGVSRSGITISAGLLVGARRDEAARFSFLLSMPAIAGAAVLEGRKLFSATEPVDMQAVGVGFAVSVITGVLAIKFLLGYLKKANLNAFVAYRFALAAAIVGWVWLSH